MRFVRLLVVTLTMLLVGQLATAANAADSADAVVMAVVENDGPYVAITMLCRGSASVGATAVTVYCDVWDSGTTSISHYRIYNQAGVCFFKSNQMIEPIRYCARVDAEFPDGHKFDEDCHTVGSTDPPRDPPTNHPTFYECLEPTPLPPPPI